MAFPDGEHGALADHLNRREMDALDAPPFLGAWCASEEDNGLSFVGFLPNATRVTEGIPATVLVWLAQRSRFAWAALREMGYE